MNGDIKGRLSYVLENCEIALRELCSVNKQLRDAMNVNSIINPQPLGDLNRMIQGYLIVCVASLFDSDRRAVSFENLLRSDPTYESIKEEPIIKKIVKNRHTWIAHNDSKGEMFPTGEICGSNLEELLKSLRKLLGQPCPRRVGPISKKPPEKPCGAWR